ncbi:PREDICTED: putative RING-H2 finger protein ATL21A [Theobroma cacao]|uniref:RING-type E3 ubiquitin transferase n=1 Tax=Theobroma cacao TaxID=3641 RepID=A0AB32VYX8_THECC|nr:PREDICTED: putative RING-H2 finger protein ATL21A [Theobroma cacao]
MSFVLAFLLLLNVGATQDICVVKNCTLHGPPVRFPFWLKHKQPPHCGFPHPAFQLSCTGDQQTLLHLPRAVKMLVDDIDYKAQEIYLSDPDGCLNRQLPHLDLHFSASPFQLILDDYLEQPDNQGWS